SATFAATGTNTQTVPTDASGVATSSVLTANAIPGSYSVNAAAAGLAVVPFALSNLAPLASFQASSLSFGTVAYEHTGTQSIDITNTGSSDLHVSQANADGDFSITGSNCDAAIAPQAHCTLTLTFAPTALGARSGHLTIVSDSAADPGSVALDGTGSAAQASLTLSLDDGIAIAQPNHAVTYTLTVANNGPDRAPQTALSDTFPAVLTACSWTSTAAGGATGNTAGPVSSNIAELLDLPMGSSVTYVIHCTVAANAAAGTLTHTATLATDALVSNGGSAGASDVDAIVTDVIFLDGFDH
ncbi:MAG TPA: choice-of-anchor D domain-containing protein, partial [Rudaea sp.]